MTPPLFADDICVMVAARNAVDTIGRAVASALRQPEVREVIVVDDASTDATADAARIADDGSGRLRVETLPQNVGPAAARNRALAATKSEFVCVLDADDWLQAGRFARLAAAATGQWDLLADDLLRAPENAPDTPTSLLLGLSDGQQSEIDLVGFVAGNLPDPRRPRRELGYLQPLMRRSFLDEAGLRYDETLRLGEDFVLYTEALLRGARLLLLPACGYVAVEQSRSLSRVHGVRELAALLAADDRLVAEARRTRPDAVPILRAHRQSVRRNLAHRSALAAKQDGDWAGVMRHFFSSPDNAAYILGQTLQARMTSMRKTSGS